MLQRYAEEISIGFNPRPSLLTGERASGGWPAGETHNGFNPRPSLLTDERLVSVHPSATASAFQSTSVIADGRKAVAG